MLPSQSTRMPSRRRNTFRRRRSRLLPAVVGVLVLIAVSVGLWLSFSGARERSAKLDPKQGADPSARSTALPPAVSTVTSPRLIESNRDDRAPEKKPVTPPAASKLDETPVNLATDDEGGIEGDPSVDPRAAGREDAPIRQRGRSNRRERSPSRIGPRPSARRRSRAASGRRPPPSIDVGSPIEQRLQLSRELARNGSNGARSAALRTELTALNERVVFSPEVIRDDPFALDYVIQPGDSLAKITRRLSLQVDWRFLQRINRIAEPHRIRSGQRIKVITGPFHVVVDRAAYRMDVYLGEGDDRVYVRSFPVGLGEYNSTPSGRFRVASGSKLIDPEWINPRTRQRFAPEDPDNPIGEHWIGLVGIDEATEGMLGYGIHGTIEPKSIGSQSSMGCIRMNEDDVAMLYEMLIEDVSTVTIE